MRLRPLEQPGDLGWVVQRHGELYAEQFGWDAEFEALVARIVADFAGDHDPVREAAWIAEVDGRRAGCLFCVARDDDAAALRILLVEPFARGRGVGTALVGACVDFAREAGYRELVCGRTTRSPRPGASTTPPASGSSARSHIAASGTSSSASTSRSSCDGSRTCHCLLRDPTRVGSRDGHRRVRPQA